jgi:uncharacterized protein (TIRG00374 family)
MTSRLFAILASRSVRRVAGLTVLALLVVFVVLPQFAGAERALHSIQDIAPALLAAGVALELLSLACFGALTRSVLDEGTRPGFSVVLRVDLVGVGVSNSLPGGGATALAVRYRLLSRMGVRPSGVAGSLAVEIVVSNLVLAALFATGLLFSIASLPAGPVYRIAGVGMIAVFAAAGAGLVLLSRGNERAVAFTASVCRRLSADHRQRVTDFVALAAGTVAEVLSGRRRLGVATFWATSNWLLDAAALWVLLAAFGYRADPAQLLVVYGLATLVGMIPITPGGLGVVEGLLVPSLIALGAPADAALLGVTAWRLAQFWMPIPVGALAAASLAAGPRLTHLAAAAIESSKKRVRSLV